MKTLRAKLFISIGIILLLAGILNTLSAEMWIKKDLSKAGEHISQRFEQTQNSIHKFISFILTFHIVQQATELERVVQLTGTKTLPSENTSPLWQNAKEILSYNPNIAFVQIQNSKGQCIAIAPEDASFSSFSWTFNSKGTLLIKIEKKTEIFTAVPYNDYYLLFKTDADFSNLNFLEVSIPSHLYSLEDSPEHLFQSLLILKHEWLQKLAFIEQLLTWQKSKKKEVPFGIIKLDFKKGEGSCLLTKELFSTTPLVLYNPEQEKEAVPDLVLRTTSHGNVLDMVKSISILDSDKTIITMGFSFSSLLKDVSLLLQKTIIATGKDFAIESTSVGEIRDLKGSSISIDSILQDKNYVVSSIDLQVLKLFLLTPADQASATARFLLSVAANITEKISFTLMGAGLFSFFIALILLNNISKKITDPISVLSEAAKTLETGNYTDIVLPQIQHRKDEISVLARSFEGMVSALKDRDKIQGLLNKVVSKEISQKILEQNIELSGEEKIVTLLFSDIRNFTHLAEGLPPHILIDILNAYMTRMCRIIDETHGVVDKFIGDEIMTLYGAPVALDFHAVKAVEAALCMIEDLSFWNKERLKTNQTVFEIGIGIHTGIVYTGNMGAENRLNYTAIGANVNQASRICSVAKPMQILISEETLRSPGVEAQFVVQKLDPVQLKGIQNPVQIYEVLSRKI